MSKELHAIENRLKFWGWAEKQKNIPPGYAATIQRELTDALRDFFRVAEAEGVK